LGRLLRLDQWKFNSWKTVASCELLMHVYKLKTFIA